MSLPGSTLALTCSSCMLRSASPRSGRFPEVKGGYCGSPATCGMDCGESWKLCFGACHRRAQSAWRDAAAACERLLPLNVAADADHAVAANILQRRDSHLFGQARAVCLDVPTGILSLGQSPAPVHADADTDPVP